MLQKISEIGAFPSPKSNGLAQNFESHLAEAQVNLFARDHPLSLVVTDVETRRVNE